MTRELRDIGLTVGRRRIARLMRDNGLRARQRRRFKRTTNSHTPGRSRPTCSIRTSRLRGPTRSGARHLLCLDPRRLVVPRRRHRPVRTPGRRLGNRRPAASRPGPRRSAQSPGHAPSGNRADPPLGSRQPVLLNRLSGRTAQARHPISMSGKGNCYDNAMVETFFKTLKSELVWPPSSTPAKKRPGQWPLHGRVFDPVRRHSALDFTSPAQFEKIGRRMT